MNCMDLTSKRTKMLNYVPNHLKHSKTTKVIKLRWIGSIWRQNDQKCWVTSETIPNTAKLQKWSNYDELDRFDFKTIKNVELRPKPFKTTQTYKSNQIAMNWIDLMSKTSNNAKLQKWSNYEEVHGFDVKTNKNVELRPKPFKTTQIYKIYQSTMNCIDLMSKTSNNAKLQKWSNYDELHRFDVKTIKKCCVTSQTIPNTAKLQTLSKYNELHRFDVKTIKYVELRPKPFQTQQNYKSDQITMNWIDLTSKRSKMLSYVRNHSKHSKTTKVIKLRWSAWIWRQNEQKCWVSRKPFKTTQIYKGYQSTMNCIDLMSKR